VTTGLLDAVISPPQESQRLVLVHRCSLVGEWVWVNLALLIPCQRGFVQSLVPVALYRRFLLTNLQG